MLGRSTKDLFKTFKKLDHSAAGVLLLYKGNTCLKESDENVEICFGIVRLRHRVVALRGDITRANAENTKVNEKAKDFHILQGNRLIAKD